MGDSKDGISLVKLRSVSDGIVLSMIKAILDDNDIPYIIKDKGAGGYMRIMAGMSSFGADVMIAKRDFDRANSLLESISIE